MPEGTVAHLAAVDHAFELSCDIGPLPFRTKELDEGALVDDQAGLVLVHLPPVLQLQVLATHLLPGEEQALVELVPQAADLLMAKFDLL